MADITNRLVLRLLNEAVACLREGVVGDAQLLDAGMVFGTGFAPFRGGRLHLYSSNRPHAGTPQKNPIERISDTNSGHSNGNRVNVNSEGSIGIKGAMQLRLRVQGYDIKGLNDVSKALACIGFCSGLNFALLGIAHARGFVSRRRAHTEPSIW